jgi:hypothetical protein
MQNKMRTKAQSIQISERLESTDDLSDLYRALISDVLSGRITTQRSNAAVYAAAKLLRLKELEFRRAESGGGSAPGPICLSNRQLKEAIPKEE